MINVILGVVMGIMLVLTIGSAFLASEEKEERYRSRE
jgi:hypothetical protein